MTDSEHAALQAKMTAEARQAVAEVIRPGRSGLAKKLAKLK